MKRHAWKQAKLLVAAVLAAAGLSACAPHFTDSDPPPPHWAPAVGPYDSSIP